VAESTVERIKHNNSVFKDANERIRIAADAHEHDFDQLPFLCECPVEHCCEIVRLTKDEYAAIREDSNLYFTAVGHEAAEKPVGRVVERMNGYIVVEKA
jgi:hypothetical protein